MNWGNKEEITKKLSAVRANLSEKLFRKAGSTRLDPVALSDWVTRSLQRQGAAFYGTAATVILCAYFLSSLTALLAGKYIPDAPLARPIRTDGENRRTRTLENYGVIFSRNLFSSENIIPGEETPVGTPTDVDPNAAPVRTTLPFNLIGTMILRDELRSIATIEDKTASAVYPVRIEDEIPSKARIIKIEARKVIFINLSANRKEFVDLPEEANILNPRINLGARGGGGGRGTAIEQTAPNTFNVARAEVDKAFADLNNVLTQARAVPNFENGAPAGYKLFQIVPGSIYAQLGLKDGDIIVGFDGQPANDPAKALEAMNNLRTANHTEIQVKRGGKLQTFSYDIR